MAYDKLKTETYEMTGGVNTKASPYVNAPNEFRSIVNMNFSTPGSLTKRPGSTDYVGASFIGASTTNEVIGGVQFNSIVNSYYSILFSDRNNIYVKDSSYVNASLLPSGISNLVVSGISTPIDSVLSFATYSDRIFYANGNVFRRNSALGVGSSPIIIGTTAIPIPNGYTITQSFGDYKCTLPQPVTIGSETFITGYTFSGFTVTHYGSQTFLASISNLTDDFFQYSQVPPTYIEGGQASFIPNMNGYYSVSLAYENDRGYIGPESAAFGGSILFNGVTTNALKLTIDPFSYLSFTAAIAGGAKFLDIFMSIPNGGNRFLAKKFPLSLATGSTRMVVFFNDPYNGTTVDSYSGYGVPLGVPANSDLNLQDVKPRYLEIYNNQLFIAGVRGTITSYADKNNQKGQYEQPVTENPNQSTVYWSEIGEPEAFSPENFAEIRTNDGDRITGMRSYAGSLIITKQKSFHRLTGSDPTNFLLQELSDQYGCLSNQAMVLYENKLWFLDQKGICEYNGANITIISNKIQPIFDSMNISAALERATAIHYKQQNEVWFAIPTDGATTNNTVIVFDYLSNVWTVYKGLNPSCLFLGTGSLSYARPFIGGYSGTIRYMNPSSYSDAGSAISCVIETRFLADSGQSTERQYRRFYLNVDPAGTTQAINVNFRTNFGSSNVLNRTMYQDPFQSRIDFGLSAKSIQAEIGQVSATLPFKVNGFTFESRYQRSV